MYCVYCGTKLPDEARFCFMCGKGVEPDRGAKDNAASANECNDEEAADVNEATRTESPDAFTNADDPETLSKNADGAKVAEGSPTPNPTVSPAPGISSDKTTVIPLATPSDKTTILPGFGAEKAALEQEKSDEIAALAALYPDASPAQFCDPTPFEAKSPDITEFIAPMPINGAKPASAESIHYAESPKKKSAGKRALLIAFVAIVAVLATAAAFGMSFDISPN